MPIVRTVRCNICGHEETEASHGSGWKDWLWVQGAVLDGDDQVWLCPRHRTKVMDFIDNMKNGNVVLLEE